MQDRSDRDVGMDNIGKCVNCYGVSQQEAASGIDLLLGAVQSVAAGGGASAGSRITDGKLS